MEGQGGFREFGCPNDAQMPCWLKTDHIHASGMTAFNYGTQTHSYLYVLLSECAVTIPVPVHKGFILAGYVGVGVRL